MSSTEVSAVDGYMRYVVASNIRARRGRLRLSQQDLTDRMVKLGHSWHQTTVTRIEQGRRGVILGELFNLAACLSTTVVGLCDPGVCDTPESLAVIRGLLVNEHDPWGQGPNLVVRSPDDWLILTSSPPFG